jgi:N-acetylneuraminate lyase
MQFEDFLLIAPPHTPFDQKGRLALDVVDQQAQLLADTTVNGVFVAGSTGEGASLTVRERIALAERWVEVAPARELDVIIQVGHNCQADATELAQHAQSIGADAVSAHAPSYFRPVNVDALIAFLAPIAAAAGDLPFFYYDIPPATGVRLPMVEFLKKAKTQIPNLAGLKYSNDDLVQLQECVRFNDGEFRVMFGCDEILLAGVTLGVQGGIGSTYNFAAPLYRRMLLAFANGDRATARECQAKSVALVRCMMRYGFMSACKTAMSWFGVDCGPTRPPFRELTADERHSLRGDLDQLGVFAPAFARGSEVLSAQR